MDLGGQTGTGNTALKRSGIRTFLAIVVALVLLASLALWVASMVPSLMTPTISPGQLDAAMKVIAQAQQDGLLVRYSCEENRAHVQPVPWRALSDELKKSLAAALGTTCQAEGHGNRMSVVDLRTGRDLANFSSGSFRVF
jgi:hypothetical protein